MDINGNFTDISVLVLMPTSQSVAIAEPGLHSAATETAIALTAPRASLSTRIRMIAASRWRYGQWNMTRYRLM